jgi:hypothetical protein
LIGAYEAIVASHSNAWNLFFFIPSLEWGRQEMDMTNEELVKKIKELLKTDANLEFLLGLKRKELETLVACIRGRVDQVGGSDGRP